MENPALWMRAKVSGFLAAADAVRGGHFFVG